MKFSAVTCGSTHRIDNVFAVACVPRWYRVSCSDIPKATAQRLSEEINRNATTRSHLGTIAI